MGEVGEIGEVGKPPSDELAGKLFDAFICEQDNQPMEKFEDLYVWQNGIEVAGDVFGLFENSNIFSIKNQIERAVVSISTNVADGYELGTDRQFVKFLYIAKGSCGEVRSLLLLSTRLRHLREDEARPLIEKCSKLSVMIYNLIKARQKK